MARQNTQYTTGQTSRLAPADKDVQKYLDEWQKGKDFVDAAIKDFKRLDTIANAQYDDPNSNSKNPQIGDTTVAGIIRQIMRTAVKQLPHISVAINGSQNTVEAIVCRNRVEKVLLNPNTFGKGLVNILHLGGRGSLSRGFNVFQVSATKLYNEFGVMPKLIHYNDFAIEPGTQDGSHSPYFYIRTKWTPGKLQDLYNREKAKAQGKSTYNLPAIKALLDVGPDSNGSSDYAQWVTPMEVSKIDADAKTFDIITRYPMTFGNKDICTFTPALTQKLRTVTSRSKFGFPRVLFLVIDPAELSPFGDSRVRLASPNQNFLMALRQNVATTWLYNSKPTMVKSGLFTGATTLKAGGVINSTDPQATVKLLTLDTTTAQQYPAIRQDITDQIQSMMGMNPGVALGSIGQSKTGIGAQKQAQSIDDAIQQVTSIIEQFLCQYIISGLDLYLSEQDGEGVIYVDDATKEDILRIQPTDSNGNPTFGDPKNPNALKVNWNQLYKDIKQIDVTADTTMSKQDWTDKKRADLQDAVTTLSQTTNPNDPAAVAKKNIVEDKLLSETAPELAPALDSIPSTPPTQPATSGVPTSNLTPPGQ